MPNTDSITFKVDFTAYCGSASWCESLTAYCCSRKDVFDEAVRKVATWLELRNRHHGQHFEQARIDFIAWQDRDGRWHNLTSDLAPNRRWVLADNAELADNANQNEAPIPKM